MSLGIDADTLNKYTALRIDWLGLLLAALFVGVIIAGVMFMPTAESAGAEPALEDESATTNAAAGGIWALVEVFLALLIIAGLVLWGRVPNILQRALRRGIWYGFFVLLGIYASTTDNTLLFFLGTMFVVSSFILVDEYGLYWTVNNVIAIVLAVAFASYAGVSFSYWLIGAGLIGLSMYDHYFANENKWMFSMAGAFVSKRLPVTIILPKDPRMMWRTLVEAFRGNIDEDGKELLHFGIGTADVALPALFAVSVAARSDAFVGPFPIEVYGIIIGVVLACFHLRYSMEERGSGAGLPPLAAGSIGGWIGAVLIWQAFLALGGI